MQKNYKYDVALSFAGEDRVYVEKVATFLKQQKVKVFYDKFEETNLWGKNLYTHLSNIYKDEARYTVMFISKFYASKLWTNHERESAQARAFDENSEYILPARFDDTKIPGVLNTVGYISLSDHTPNEFAEIICKKLGKEVPVKTVTSKEDLSNSAAIKHTAQITKQPKKSTLEVTQDLIKFANASAGFGMPLPDARDWALDNIDTFNEDKPAKDYISKMTELIKFANVSAGLGMPIRDARDWALDNIDSKLNTNRKK